MKKTTVPIKNAQAMFRVDAIDGNGERVRIESLAPARDLTIGTEYDADYSRPWHYSDSLMLIRTRIRFDFVIEREDAIATGTEGSTHRIVADPAQLPVELVLSDPRDSLKMLRETLCEAQAFIGRHGHEEDSERIGRLIAEIDRQRPLGPDGKHGNLHTLTCGCEDRS